MYRFAWTLSPNYAGAWTRGSRRQGTHDRGNFFFFSEIDFATALAVDQGSAERFRRNTRTDIAASHRHPLQLFTVRRQVQTRPDTSQRTEKLSRIRTRGPGTHSARCANCVDFQTGRRRNAVQERREISREAKSFGVKQIPTGQTRRVQHRRSFADVSVNTKF